MTDLSKGIIEIEGICLSCKSKVSDFENNTNSNIEVKVSKKGNTYVRFLTPLISNNVAVYVEIDFYTNNNIPKITLYPAVPSELEGKYDEVAKYKLDSSKAWLKGMITCEPHTLNDSCVFYKFESVDYFSAITKDIHYGLVGGEISVTFRGV